jgi:hypothetical protein
MWRQSRKKCYCNNPTGGVAMASEGFAALLLSELYRLYETRKQQFETFETLTREHGTIRRRIELLRELLVLEGTHVDLPDTFTEKTYRKG